MRSAFRLRLCVPVVGAVQVAAAECPAVDASEADRVPTAVHVVYGPLPMDGDPRLAHYLEHFWVAAEAEACGLRREGSLDGWTGPDTLHFVWQGEASPAGATRVAERLAHLSVDPVALADQWPALDEEVAWERARATPSTGEALLQATAGVHSRHRRPLRGAVGFSMDAADLLNGAPVTTVIARAGAPVSWHTTRVPRSGAPTITPIDRPPGADLAWRVEGALGCEQRRALWAAVAGVAATTGGTPIGWLGARGGVVGVADAERTRWSPRKARVGALDWDATAVDHTLRRSQDPGDQTWMAVGHLGLGVCPSTAPLPPAAIDAGLAWLEGPVALPGPPPVPTTGTMDLPAIPRAAVWHAGTPPRDWLDAPGWHGTRTPGGYTIDAPVERLAELGVPPPAQPLVSLDDPTEQALVLMGAGAVDVPCRVLGPPTVSCTSSGQLRVPSGHSLVVVDVPTQQFIQVAHVRSLDPTAPGVRRAIYAELGPGSARARALEVDARVRDYHLTIEPVRAVVSLQAPVPQLRAVLPWFLPDEVPNGVDALREPDHTVPTGRLAGRPWEAVSIPGDPLVRSAPLVAPPPGELLVVHGPADAIVAALAEFHVEPDRVLSTAQLAAEAGSIRP